MFKKLRGVSPVLVMGCALALLYPLAALASQVLSPPVSAPGALAGAIVKVLNSATGPALTAQAQGNALISTSTRQNGVLGVTQFGSATSTSNGAGVYGVDATANTHNQGVAGRSSSGTGVLGISTSNSHTPSAMYAVARGGIGITSVSAGPTDSTGYCGSGAVSAISIFATATLGDSSDGHYCGQGIAEGYAGTGVNASGFSFGVLASANMIPGKGPAAIAVEGIGDQGARFVANGYNFATSGPALELEQQTAGALILSARSSAAGGGMSLDENGNLVISGTLTQHGTPGAPVYAGGFSSGSSFAAGRSSATVEDVGDARLASGVAYVRFNPALTRGIDFTQRYDVFVTPEGPNAGVYVTEKSARGFIVRENPGGRSNVDFSYRIVARAVNAAPHANAGALKPADLTREKRAIANMNEAAQRARAQIQP
ncbi:MAG: hypothetical protein NVSMB64_08030 [Candidatus Velthaea sp.]